MAKSCPPGKVWAGSDYGCQNPQTIWKKQAPGAKVGETKSLPGLGKKVWTGKDYGWQTQATIDARKKGAKPPVAPTTPQKPSPTPSSTPASTPASTPGPTSGPPQRKAPSPTPTPQKPKTSSATASTAEKIKGGSEVYKRQIKMGDIKGAEATGKATWALANPKLAAAAAERERTRGTSATTNPQMADLKSRLPAPKTASSEVSAPPPPKVKTDTAVQRVQTVSQPAAKSIEAEVKKRNIPTFNTSKMTTTLRQSYEYDAYDLVLEYLFDTGHVDTIEEANYVMMQMDEKTIGSIVEEKVSEIEMW